MNGFGDCQSNVPECFSSPLTMEGLIALQLEADVNDEIVDVVCTLNCWLSCVSGDESL